MGLTPDVVPTRLAVKSGLNVACGALLLRVLVAWGVLSARDDADGGASEAGAALTSPTCKDATVAALRM